MSKLNTRLLLLDTDQHIADSCSLYCYHGMKGKDEEGCLL